MNTRLSSLSTLLYLGALGVALASAGGCADESPSVDGPDSSATSDVSPIEVDSTSGAGDEPEPVDSEVGSDSAASDAVEPSDVEPGELPLDGRVDGDSVDSRAPGSDTPSRDVGDDSSDSDGEIDDSASDGDVGPDVPPDDPSYTLFTPMSGTQTFVIDDDLQVLHVWDHGTVKGSTVYLLDDGTLLRSGRVEAPTFTGAGGFAGRVDAYSWDSANTWTYQVNTATAHHHHDFAPLPNGHIVVIAWDRISSKQAQLSGRDPDLIDAAQGVWSEQLLEYDPVTKSVVWQWRLWDHIVQDRDADKPNFAASTADRPERFDINYGLGSGIVDWWHINSVDYDPNRDQLVLSSAFHSEIYVIDHSTTTEEAASSRGGLSGRGGDILYRWGNPAAYASGGAEDRGLYAQHDAKWVPPGYVGAGHITIFSNGQVSLQPYSSVVELALPEDVGGGYNKVAGEPFGPVIPTWEYIADPPESLFSDRVSGAHRLPGGDTQICSGIQGLVTRVTQSGETVWSWEFDDIGLFRAERYPATHPAFEGRDLTPKGPLDSFL